MDEEIARAIALLQTEYDIKPFTDDRAEMWMNALCDFAPGSVLKSAQNYMRTNKFKPQLADIVQGCEALTPLAWLDAEEAWARLPKSEADSAMLTSELAEAWAVAKQFIPHDMVSARMSFKGTYGRLVAKAHMEFRRPKYFPSFGSEKSQQGTMLAQAVKDGLIQLQVALDVKPEYATDIIAMVGVKNHPLLAVPSQADRDRLKALMLTLKGPQ